MGLNPWMAPGPAAVQPGLYPTNGASYLTVTYRLAKPAVPDIATLVDYSTNLATSSWTTNGVVLLGTADRGTYTETTLRAPFPCSPRSQGFLRPGLRLTSP